MKIALLLGSLVVFAGCGPEAKQQTGPLAHAESASGKYALDVFTDPQPPVRGQVAARLAITSQGTPARGLTPKVTPWMVEHAHGTSVVPTVAETENGDYQVTDLYLPMEGTWQLRTDVDGSKDDEIDVTIEVR